jgi:hypothetical protein
MLLVLSSSPPITLLDTATEANGVLPTGIILVFWGFLGVCHLRRTRPQHTTDKSGQQVMLSTVNCTTFLARARVYRTCFSARSLTF